MSNDPLQRSTDTNAGDRSRNDRLHIATWVLGVAGVILAIWAAVLIFLGWRHGEGFVAAEKAFTMIVPLIGTWVGTVIAYYFSSENFQRATDSVTRLASQVADERLRATRVTDAMIPMSVAVVVRLPQGDDESAVNLANDVCPLLNDRVTRLPIIDSAGRLKYIIHGSVVFRFISDKATSQSPKTKVDFSSFTLKDLLDHSGIRAFASRTTTFVSKSDTLAEAKRRMEAVEQCQDVFVTETGTPDEPALGWITNIIISRKARA